MAIARFVALLLAGSLAGGAGSLFLQAPAGADDVPGDVIVATAEGDAAIVWDSTPDVERIVKEKQSDDAANSLLERDALRVISANLKDLKKATSITVHVHYNKTADVNPAYNGATFVGVERYALVTIDAHDANSDKDKWQQLGEKTAIPSWVKYKVTGQLPPR
jgi:hypothetical protein